MNKQGVRIRNWSDYNKALINRGSITFWLSNKSMLQWHYSGKRNPGGVLLYSDLAIQVCLTIKEVYRLAYRQTQGFIDSLFACLGNKTLKSPNYTRLCRRTKSIKIKIVGNIKPDSNICVLVDSTGIKIFGENEWYSSKYGRRQRQKWCKLHISINHETQEILSAKITPANVHDASHFKGLLEDIADSHDITEVIGDGAYSLNRCHVVTDKIGSMLVAPPHSNSRKQIENRNYHDKPPTPTRDAMIDFVRSYGSHEEGLNAWKDKFDYHRRSLVETAMFRLKSNFGSHMRARTADNQEKILLIRCAALNKMTSLGMPAYC